MAQTSRKIKGVIVHCTATAPTFMEGYTTDEKRDEVGNWHTLPKPKGRGWRAIGYDALCDRDGTEAIGRDLDKDGIAFEDVGAHAAGHNRDYVSVALFGGHGSNENDRFSDHFTPEQEAWLVEKIQYLRKRFGKDIEIRGHNEFAAKACPGFQVGPWWADAKRRYGIDMPKPEPLRPQPLPKVERKPVPRPATSDGRPTPTEQPPVAVDKILRGKGRDSIFKLQTIRSQIAQWIGLATGVAASVRAAWVEADPIVQAAIIVAAALIVWIAIRHGGRVFIERVVYFLRGLD